MVYYWLSWPVFIAFVLILLAGFLIMFRAFVDQVRNSRGPSHGPESDPASEPRRCNHADCRAPNPRDAHYCRRCGRALPRLQSGKRP